MSMLNLYLVGREDHIGYDEYVADVVAAVDEKRAIELSNIGYYQSITIEKIGCACNGTEEGVILYSFNAG